MNYQYIVVYIILLAIIAYNLKIQFNKTNLNNSMKNLNNLRGFFAIIIILGHFIQKLNPIPTILKPIPKISTICVAYYFFMSGYGLVYQFLNKKDYMKKFLIKKYLSIGIVLVGFIVLNYLLNISGFILFNSPINFISINWYIIEISLLYLLFYISYKLYSKDRKKRIFILITMVTASCVIALITKCPRVYYISELPFLLGIIISEYSIEIEKIFSKKIITVSFWMFIIICFVISLSSAFVKEYTILDLVTHNLLCITSMLLLVGIFFYINANNKVLDFLKKISFEMYIYQFPLLFFKNLLFKNNIIKYNIFTMIIFVVLNIIIAYVGNVINQKIIKKIAIR